MATQIQMRRDTAANWTSNNPTLAAGEIGFETDQNKFKIGTGTDDWATLAYGGGSGGASGPALTGINSIESEAASDLRLEGNLNVEIFTQGNDITSGNPDVSIGYGGISCYSVSVTELTRNVYTETIPGGGNISLDYNNGSYQQITVSQGDPTIIDISNGNDGSTLDIIAIQPSGTDCLIGASGNIATPNGTITQGLGGNDTFDKYSVARFHKVSNTWIIDRGFQTFRAPNA